MKGLSIAALLIAAASACQTDLNGAFEFPHLIIPVDASKPDNTPGTSYFGEVSENVTSIFNFDIPSRQDLPSCTLVFHFPGTDQRGADTYRFEGDGNVRFGLLNGFSTASTSYNNRPSVQTDYGVRNLQPGHAYMVANFPCPGGQTISVQMENAGSTDLSWFEDYGNPPFGLFVTMCA